MPVYGPLCRITPDPISHTFPVRSPDTAVIGIPVPMFTVVQVAPFQWRTSAPAVHTSVADVPQTAALLFVVDPEIQLDPVQRNRVDPATAQTLLAEVPHIPVTEFVTPLGLTAQALPFHRRTVPALPPAHASDDDLAQTE